MEIISNSNNNYQYQTVLLLVNTISTIRCCCRNTLRRDGRRGLTTRVDCDEWTSPCIHIDSRIKCAKTPCTCGILLSIVVALHRTQRFGEVPLLLVLGGSVTFDVNDPNVLSLSRSLSLHLSLFPLGLKRVLKSKAILNSLYLKSTSLTVTYRLIIFYLFIYKN